MSMGTSRTGVFSIALLDLCGGASECDGVEVALCSAVGNQISALSSVPCCHHGNLPLGLHHALNQSPSVCFPKGTQQ